MTTPRVARRAAFTALFLPVLLTACGGPPPPVRFAPLSWDYLQPLKLNVATVDVDTSWVSRAGSREKGFLAPTPPVDALRRMAEDRLIPGGASGRAVFVIDDASIVQLRESYQGNFAVHLDVLGPDGTRRGFATARVARTHVINDDSPNAVRSELYDMVKQMMSDMNVEFRVPGAEIAARRSADHRAGGTGGSTGGAAGPHVAGSATRHCPAASLGRALLRPWADAAGAIKAGSIAIRCR